MDLNSINNFSCEIKDIKDINEKIISHSDTNINNDNDSYNSNLSENK